MAGTAAAEPAVRESEFTRNDSQPLRNAAIWPNASRAGLRAAIPLTRDYPIMYSRMFYLLFLILIFFEFLAVCASIKQTRTNASLFRGRRQATLGDAFCVFWPRKPPVVTQPGRCNDRPALLTLQPWDLVITTSIYSPGAISVPRPPPLDLSSSSRISASSADCFSESSAANAWFVGP
jgi:hypothetical protein